MLLVIHNLPLNTRFVDIKSLLLEKCGLQNLILDKLILEDNAKRITVGLPTEEDAAILVRKINGLYLKGHQLYVQDLRQKPSEQPYRLPNPSNKQNNNQQNWDNNQQPNWDNNQQQNWDNNQQPNWDNNQQPNWNIDEQQGWNSSQQSWKNPSQNRNNESQRNSNPFLYPQLNQNVQGYEQELKDASARWAQQSQQVNAMYDNQSVHYPQNVQYPQELGQVDNHGYADWGQSNQNLGFEQGGGDYTNSNTSWGESSYPAQSRGRSQESRQFKDSHRSRFDRSFEQNSRELSRHYSQPREERLERPQPGNKRRWDDRERCDDDGWRQRPASPPREFRQLHQGRDKGAPQRSGFEAGVQPWGDAPNQRFKPSNAKFEAPKQVFHGPKPRFEAPKPKFNKNKKFNAPNQKFNKFNPKFNSSYSSPHAANPSQYDFKKNKLETIPWHMLTKKQKEKIIKTNEFCRSSAVHNITVNIFNELGISLDDIDLRKYFTDPVRARLDKVLGDDKFMPINQMYANYLDAYNDEKQMILEEAKQLQKDGVEPKLQKLNIKQVFPKPPPGPHFVEKPNVPEAKRFKADAVITVPRPGPSAPSKPVSGKIPSYIDGDKKRFKAIKHQHMKDMTTLRCPDVGTELDKIVDDEVDDIAKIFHKVIERTPDETPKTFLQGRATEECIDDFKKMFKQKICQRLANEGAKIVRIYANSGKPPKKAELEPFMRQFGVLALKKSDRKPFFTAHLDSYRTLDKLCNMGNIQIGNSDVIFKPLHMTPKYKRVHISSLKIMRDKYVSSQIKRPEVNILEKDWEIKLAAIKEKEEILKEEKTAADAAKEEILKQEKAAQNAEIKDTDVKAENGDVQPENGNVKPENGNVKPENGNVKPENSEVHPENDTQQANDNVEPENNDVIPENHNTVHTDKYGELHSNFDVIDEVQGSDTENCPTNDGINIVDDFNDEAPGRSDESLLRDLPVCSDHEIIFDDDDSDGDYDQASAQDIDLDNIDENDLEDY